MQIDVMLALQDRLKKDYSKKNQLGQTALLRVMLEINQAVVVSGIAILEEYEEDILIFPMLCRGLGLVRNGVEPKVIETILLNTALTNDVDLLESLLVIEGVLSIQTLQAPDVTKELLLSYFSLDIQDSVRKGLQDLKLNCSEVLRMEEVEKLIEKTL